MRIVLPAAARVRWRRAPEMQRVMMHRNHGQLSTFGIICLGWCVCKQKLFFPETNFRTCLTERAEKQWRQTAAVLRSLSEQGSRSLLMICVTLGSTWYLFCLMIVSLKFIFLFLSSYAMHGEKMLKIILIEPWLMKLCHAKVHRNDEDSSMTEYVRAMVRWTFETSCTIWLPLANAKFVTITVIRICFHLIRRIFVG